MECALLNHLLVSAKLSGSATDLVIQYEETQFGISNVDKEGISCLIRPPTPRRGTVVSLDSRVPRETTMIAIIFALLLSGSKGSSHSRDPIAKTPLGELRGYTMTSREGRRFMAFSGIPFAKPPSGDLAFEPPQPVESWNGMRDAKTDGPLCIQYNLYDINATVKGQQDCLYLSVYTHDLNGRAPVMVHIHGGGFISGSGANSSKPRFFMDEDIVLVNINYRVGIFGFLSFEDLDMPGNQGLKDQVMALRWVQKNIASFGGDPNRVTLVGESAGAGSVYHHTISPLSKGLFHGGIAESGSSYGLWAYAVEGYTRNLSIALVKQLGCPFTTTREAVACLKSKDPAEVASKLEREWQIDPIFNFGPVPEPAGPGAFLSGPVSKWKHNPVPLIMGSTSGEGLLRTIYFNITNMSFKWYSDNFEKVAPKSLLYFSSASNPNEVTRAVRNYYLPNGEITENDWVNLTTMYGDSWITIGVLDGANNHTGDVYYYYFDYIGDYFGKQWGVDATNKTIIFGAPHTEEIVYLWDYPNFVQFEGKDLELSKRLIKLWTNFAKYGTPTPKQSKFHWPKWTKSHHRYVHIDENAQFKVEEGFAEDRYRFWKNIDYRDNYD